MSLYNTYYELDCYKCYDKTIEEITKWCRENWRRFNLYWESRIYDAESIETIVADEITYWPTAEQDMKNLSAAFPNIRFDLYGDGEERMDIWKEEYLNGKKDHFYRAELVRQ